MVNYYTSGVDPGFLKRTSILGLQAKQGGGAGAGPTLGPMLKNLHRGPEIGGGPHGPPPPSPDPPMYI